MLEKLKDNPDCKGAAGPCGPAGPKGDAGPAGEITSEQLAAITAAILSQMKADPAFRGPTGPSGNDASINVDELTNSILARLPPIEVRVDGGKPAIQSLADAAAEGKAARFHFKLKNELQQKP